MKQPAKNRQKKMETKHYMTRYKHETPTA
jgi:hypothetical protein